MNKSLNLKYVTELYIYTESFANESISYKFVKQKDGFWLCMSLDCLFSKLRLFTDLQMIKIIEANNMLNEAIEGYI